MSEKNFNSPEFLEESGEDSFHNPEDFHDRSINGEQEDIRFVETGGSAEIEQEPEGKDRDVRNESEKNHDNKKFPWGKVAFGGALALGLASLRGSTADTEEIREKRFSEEKESISSPLGIEKERREDTEFIINEEKTYEGQLLEDEGLLTEDSIEKEKGDVVEEIRDIIENINSQSLEDRVGSKLTVDVGLIAFMSEEFPELGVPNLSFDQAGGDILIKNRDVKSQVDGMNVKSLYEKFNLSGVDVDLESVLVRKGESGWNDQVLIYDGYVTADSLQKGDVVSILEGDVISEDKDVLEDSEGIRLVTVLDKQIKEDGKYVLTIISTDEEERSIDIEEIEGDSLKNILGENVFVTRKDWGGLDPEIFDFRKWNSEYVWFDMRRDFHPTSPFYMEVGNLGAHLYSFDLHDDGFINNSGQVSEILVPPGFMFDIKATASVLTPDGYHIKLGFPNIYGNEWLTRGNSAIIIMVEDFERNKVDFLNYVPNLREDARKSEEYHRIEGGYINKVLENGWDINGDFPFYVSEYSKVSEIPHLVRFCYDKEFLNGFRAYIEENRFETQSILKLGVAINKSLANPGISLQEQLKKSDWYQEYIEEMMQKRELTTENLGNIERALEYISYNQGREGIDETSFLIASGLLYPELGMQDIEDLFISKQEEEKGLFSLEELIPKELLLNPDILSFPISQEGTAYKGIDSLEFLEVGDTIVNLDKGRIGFVVNRVPFFHLNYIVYAEANRYGDGRIFLTHFFEEERFQNILGENIYVLRKNK